MPSPTTLRVPHPFRMIVVTPAEIRALSRTPLTGAAPDPDVDWDTVARALERVGDTLSYPPNFRRGHDMTVPLDAPLTGRERTLAELWFTPGVAPTLHAVTGTITGDIHWLGGVLRTARTRIPLRLALFDEIARAGTLTPEVRTEVRNQARATLARFTRGMLRQSPLATASLHRLAEDAPGDIPERPTRGRRRVGIGALGSRFARPAL
ncbi:hypothetical protein [Microbacterium sp. GXF7504]